jgi:uncharacterized protein (DUF736 family)
MSNIGELTKNENGFFMGAIDTLAVSMTLALREVHNPNPNAPCYEIHARSAAGRWVKVGALWEQASRETGEAFLQGSIDDPSLDRTLYIACFMREDGSYAIAWSRLRRSRSELPAPANSGAGMDDAGVNGSMAGLGFDGSAKTGKTKKSGTTADLGQSTSDAVNA